MNSQRYRSFAFMFGLAMVLPLTCTPELAGQELVGARLRLAQPGDRRRCQYSRLARVSASTLVRPVALHPCSKGSITPAVGEAPEP